MPWTIPDDMDYLEYRKVFSSIDQNGRYAYANQAPIAQ
jgi:uncharacterized protein YdiU (UPF0061 family)